MKAGNGEKKCNGAIYRTTEESYKYDRYNNGLICKY
jgi:hypothetical protein